LLNTRQANICKKILSFQVKSKLTHIMKTATKFAALVFTVTLLFIGANSFAQSTPKSKFRFGIGVDALTPLGDFHNYQSNFGLGVTPRLQYGLTDRVALTFTSGFYRFFSKTYEYGGMNDPIKTLPQDIIPVKLGLKAFITKNIYLGGEIGAGFETNNTGSYTGNGNGRNTKLIASGGIGYASKNWDIGARYENFSGGKTQYGTLGLRIAYGFGL
jgi:hypothetical protein